MHRSSTKDFNAALCSHHYARTAGLWSNKCKLIQEIRSAPLLLLVIIIGIEFGVANRIAMVLRNNMHAHSYH